MKNVWVSSVLGYFVVAGAVACSGDSAAPAEAEPADGGPGAALPPDVPPVSSGCDGKKTPAEDKCVLHESFGVFVSSSKGNDTNDGTRARPYATLGKAVEVAKASARRVYACAETYAEPTVTLLEGVSIFGDITCANAGWAVAPSERAVLAATTNPAARARDIVTETRVEGLMLHAPAGVVAGESSIGLVAANAAGLHFVAGGLVAAAAAAGSDGSDAVQMESPATSTGEASTPPGSCTRSTNGFYDCPTRQAVVGGAGECVAGDVRIMTNPGGEGGWSTVHEHTITYHPPPFSGYTHSLRRVREGLCVLGQPCLPSANQPGLPTVASAVTNQGAQAAYGSGESDLMPTSSSPALAGVPGVAGQDGLNAGDLGALDPAGYLPADGSPGVPGTPGQGGGGGAGVMPDISTPAGSVVGFSGSGGGAGGCPGLAGVAGGGGGASIAVLTSGAAPRFESFVLEAGAGGVGGRGGFGSLGRAGGGAGLAGGTQVYNSGAPGGSGGRGGVSGHGGSGPSFAVAWQGTQPILSADTTVKVAPPQAGRPSESRDTMTIPSGAAGLSETVHPF